MSAFLPDLGRVQHLFVKPGHRAEMRPVPSAMAVAGKGLIGDVAFGRERRQVLLVDLQSLSDLDLHPGDIRENIALQGFAVDRLPSGCRLQVGEALLEITGECAPCERMDEIRPGLQSMLRGRRGVLARVVASGTIHIGDTAVRIPASDASEDPLPPPIQHEAPA